MRLKVLLDILRGRRVALVFLALLLCGDAGLYLYGAYQQRPELASLSTTWSQKRHHLASQPRLSKAEIYRQGTADMAVFDAAIPPKRDFVRLVGDLYETAATDGLKVGAITYKPTLVKGRPLYAFAMSVVVTGSYAGIKRFIGDVARSKDMLVIDRVGLRSGSATEESVNMTMNITAYMKREGQ